MRKRWTAANMLVAEQRFRLIIGYRNLAKFVIAIERHADPSSSPPRALSQTLRCRTPLPSDCQPHVEDRRRSSTTIRASSAKP